MKLSPYVISKIEEEIKDELFRIWLETDIHEWAMLEDIRLFSLHKDYHSIFAKDEDEELRL